MSLSTWRASSRGPRPGRRAYSGREEMQLKVFGYYVDQSGRQRTLLRDQLEDAQLRVKSGAIPVMKCFTFGPALLKDYFHPISRESRIPTLDRFELFPKLPKELQLLVWRTALPTSRILEFEMGPLTILTPSSARASQTIIVNILRACRDAKRVVDKCYTQSRFYTLPGGRFSPYARYHVDLKRDVIYNNTPFSILSNGLKIAFNGTNNDSLPYEHIAVSIDELTSTNRYAAFDADDLAPETLRKLKSLKTLTFVGNAEVCVKTVYGSEYGGDDVKPFVATAFEDIPDHPYLKIKKKAIEKLKAGLKLPEVVDAFKGVEIKFVLYRRCRHDEFCRCKQC